MERSTEETECPDENVLAALVERELPEDEVRRIGVHIDACARCRDLMVAMARTRVATTDLGKRLRFSEGMPAQHERWDHRQILPPDSAVDRYRIERVLGRGGMGVVYAAYDPELDRRVALKLIRPDLLVVGKEVETRLAREARAQARLAHPNVVTAYDVGTFDGQLYVTMELVEGVTLSTWLRQERRDLSSVLDIFTAAARGLQAAHRAGLVHRDFKPDNVIIGDDGRVCVADFGLARAIAEVDDEPSSGRDRNGADNDSAARLTSTGVVLGTPAYMAPEQYAQAQPDARTDIFSFCVALYEAAYRERPFAGDSPLEISRAVRAGHVRPVGGRARVPTWLRRVLLRGLAVAPEDRFESIQELLDAIERGRRRRPVKWMAVAAIGLVLLAAGAWAYTALGKPVASCEHAEKELAGTWDPEHKAAIRAALAASETPQAQKRWRYVEQRIDAYADGWVGMRRDVCRAAQQKALSTDVLELRTHCLDTQLARLQNVIALLSSGDEAVTENALDSLRAMPRLERCSTVETLEARVPQPADAPTRAEVDAIRKEIARADVLRLAGNYSAAIALLEPLEPRAKALGYRPIEAEVLYYLGVVRDPVEGPKAADETLRRAAYAAEAGRHDEIAAEAWTYLITIVAADLADFERAHEYAERARAAIERLGGSKELQAELELNQGILFKEQSDFERAQASFARAAQLAGDDIELRLSALERSAMAHEDSGEFDDAIATYEFVLAERIRTLGPEHPDVGLAHTNLASTYMQVGRLDEALQHAQRALAIAEQTLGPDSLQTAHTRHNLAELLQFAGRYEESLEQHNRALPVLERVRGEESLDVAGALVSEGELLVRMNRADEAVTITRRALGILEKTVGESHFETARCLINFGDALREAGQHDESLTVARRGLEVLESQLGKDTPYSGFALTGIGRSLLDGGHPGEAVEPLERAIRLYEQGGIDPAQTAVARFALARSLSESKRDEKRARELATAARAVFADAGRARTLELRRVDAWLGRHPTE